MITLNTYFRAVTMTARHLLWCTRN